MKPKHLSKINIKSAIALLVMAACVLFGSITASALGFNGSNSSGGTGTSISTNK